MGKLFALVGHFQRLKVGAGRTKVFSLESCLGIPAFPHKIIVFSKKKDLHFKAVSDFPILAPKS